jgi:hypothetical protein
VNDVEHIRKNWLRRRMADRQGLKLRRSRNRDQNTSEFGKWHIVNAKGRIVAGRFAYNMTTEEVEQWLTRSGRCQDRK